MKNTGKKKEPERISLEKKQGNWYGSGVYTLMKENKCHFSFSTL